MPNKHANRKRFLTLLLLFALSACGGQAVQPTSQPAPLGGVLPTAEGEAPSDAEAPADTEAPAEAAAEPTAEENAPAATAESNQNTPDGAGYLADLGFRPGMNGFNFENYGGDPNVQNLVADDLRRMFGDQVCASKANGECILTPAGQQWMEQINQGMAGGHCEGMAALSLLFYSNKENPNDFGAGQAFDLQLADNAKLQREIAYWWATQTVAPTASMVVKGTPNEIVDRLVQSFSGDKSSGETYTIGIYKRDGTGGHAVTPYAVKDGGNGLVSIMVYDNNYPGVERNIDVDRNADTWSYTASINPGVEAAEYEGDAQTKSLDLTPSSARLPQQACPFCESAVAGRGNGLAAPEPQYNQIWLDGDADLLITDQQGHRYGYVDGAFVNEIEGVRSQNMRLGLDTWSDDSEPTYYVPVGLKFTITIDGRKLEQPGAAEILMIGPGYDLEVSDIKLEPGQVDTLDVSPDGSRLSYKTDSGESPDVTIGTETAAADYAFYIKGVDLEPGGALNIALDMNKGHISLDTTGNKEAGAYALYIDRIDDDGEQIFGHDEIVLEPKDIAYVDFLNWTGNQGNLQMQLDYGSDDTIDETIDLTDESDLLDT